MDNKQTSPAFRSWAKASSILLIACGSLVLVGWVFDISILKSILPNWVTMKANTAIAFTLGGLSLWLLPKRELLSTVCATLIAFIGILTLGEYILKIDFHIDQIFFKEDAQAIGTFSPGRMSPVTALNFSLIGLSLILLNFKLWKNFYTYLAGMVMLISFLNFTGYIYGVPKLYGIASYTQMALHTAFLFMVFSAATLCVKADTGLMAILSRKESVGGIITRQLLPVAIFVPLIIGWLRLIGERAEFYGTEFGLALTTIFSILFLTLVIWLTARKIDRVDLDRQKAEEKMKEAVNIKSEFTSMVSHELRTPLAVIKESVALVQEEIAGTLNEDQKKFLDTAQRNVDRLARLINAVLDYQKLEAGRIDFKITKNDLRELLEKTIQDFSLVSKQKNIELKFFMEENLPKINFDKDKITQVLINFLNNALKFTEKGKIEVRVKKMERMIRVSISDTGPGIKPEDKEKLFKSFSQIPTGQGGRKTGGSGLGLTISRKIIEAHQGIVGAISEYGKGSTFYFELPITSSDIIQEKEAA